MNLSINIFTTLFTQIQNQVFPPIQPVEKCPSSWIHIKGRKGDRYSLPSWGQSQSTSSCLTPTPTCSWHPLPLYLSPLPFPYCQEQLWLHSLLGTEHMETLSPAKPISIGTAPALKCVCMAGQGPCVHMLCASGGNGVRTTSHSNKRGREQRLWGADRGQEPGQRLWGADTGGVGWGWQAAWRSRRGRR